MKLTSTAKRLLYVMNERNLKQIDILNKIKEAGGYMSKSALSQYVNGKTEPDQEKLSLLADALNVSEVWLMGYDVPMTPRIQQPKQDTSDLDDDMIVLARNAKSLTPDQRKLIRNMIDEFKKSNED